ncbi:MAG: alpha/beta fold hydrolase [Chloroherpetonaceae bacterium]
MPILERSTYQPPSWWVSGGHLQTIIPALFRKVVSSPYKRERITTPDGDFLDCDWLYAANKASSRKLAVISHGLESNSLRPNVIGMARAFSLCGYDALAWNFRGCSGEPNRLARAYHSGATEDLYAVLEHVVVHYDEIYLIGFSLGANLTLKYLGEQRHSLSPKIKKAVVFSVPCDLAASSTQISRFSNRLYERRFLKSLRQKIEQKATLFPNEISLEPYLKKQIKTLRDFDDCYTAPLHGFQNADDYYAKCSSKPLIASITIPTLIINAKNDVFLPASCYPFEEAKASDVVFLETPESGGHLGFLTEAQSHGLYWSEMRALGFIESRDEVAKNG